MPMQMQATERRRESRGKGGSGSRLDSWGADRDEMGSCRSNGGCGSNGWISSSSSSRKTPYALLLLLALAAAAFSVVVVNKLREGRILGILIQEREEELQQLQVMLQEERDSSKALRSSVEDMSLKFSSLTQKKTELANRLMEAENIISYLKERERDMEQARVEGQNRIHVLTERESELLNATLEVSALKERLRAEEEKVEELKRIQSVTSEPENATATSTDTASTEAVKGKADDNGTVNGHGTAEDGNVSMQQPTELLSKVGEEGSDGSEDEEGEKSSKGERSDTVEVESSDRMLNQEGLESNSTANGNQTIHQESGGNRESKTLEVEQVTGNPNGSETTTLDKKTAEASGDEELKGTDDIEKKIQLPRTKIHRGKGRRRRTMLRGRRSPKTPNAHAHGEQGSFSSDGRQEAFVESNRVSGESLETSISEANGAATAFIETKTEMTDSSHRIDEGSKGDGNRNLTFSNLGTTEPENKFIRTTNTSTESGSNRGDDSYEETGLNSDEQETKSNNVASSTDNEGAVTATTMMKNRDNYSAATDHYLTGQSETQNEESKYEDKTEVA